MVFSSPAVPIRLGCKVVQTAPAVVMATAFSVLAAPVHSETGVVVISIESDGRVSEVSRRRLEGYLQAQGCRAQVRFNGDDPATALVFRSGVAASGAPVLVAVSRDGGLPVPAWITRRTAGVKAIGELLGRDLSTVAGGDPVGLNCRWLHCDRRVLYLKPGSSTRLATTARLWGCCFITTPTRPFRSWVLFGRCWKRMTWS